MERILISLVTLLVVAGLYVSTLISAPTPLNQQEFILGEVLTMDAYDRIVEAVSVRDGIIEQVGTTAETSTLITNSTAVVDLAGQTLMPGFVDAHSHFTSFGQTAFTVDSNSPPIGSSESIPELLEKLRAFGEK